MSLTIPHVPSRVRVLHAKEAYNARTIEEVNNDDNESHWLSWLAVGLAARLTGLRNTRGGGLDSCIIFVQGGDSR